MSDPAYAYDYNGTWTYKDYKDWELKPGERYEIIDGVAYAMSAPNTEHQRISMFLSGEFYSFLKGKPCQPFAAPYDVRLFYKEDESDNTVVQPDLVVVCDPEKLGKEGCRGAPDLVIEILSPSNNAIEMNRKLNIYRKAGVPEVWIIDPEEKQVDVYHLVNNRYVPNILQMGDILKSQKFPGFEIPLDVL
ncbi:MAG: Uma2 family endonuclease, partial [Treponema sp.]|nr:Uma2 family endonuclease [Treponema sp.]